MSDFGDTSALKPGDCFGDYTVERLLGKGGMGSVYLMRTPDGAPFAVKIMHRSEMSHDSRVRFVREAEFAMSVRHKNLVTVYDVGEDPDTGLCYIIMDYLPGGTLTDRIRARGKIPIADAVKITMHIAAALDVAHRNGLVHRDVKPDNIMFDADGIPKLADLGVAKFGEDRKTMVTMTGMMIGTPAYMSPEQFIDSHRIDARSDIYSLGVVFYEMLAGKRPNIGSTAVELLAKAVKGEPLPDIRTVCPEVSAAIANVLAMMCAPKPDDRPATTMEVSEILHKVATGRFVLPKKLPRAIEASKNKHWLKTSAVVAGVVLLVAGAVFGWRAHTGRHLAKTPAQDIPRQKPADAGVDSWPIRNAGETDTQPAAYREVQISDVPQEFSDDLEKLRSRYAWRSSHVENGRFVFGRLKVEDSSPDGVATWAWLNKDGTFTAAAIMAVKSGLVFIKNGYETLVVRMDDANKPWRDDVALDLGTVTMKKLPQEKTATITLTAHLPKGVESGTFTLMLENRSPCGIDWGTYGPERTSQVVTKVPFFDGRKVTVPGCAVAPHTLILEAEGCPKYSHFQRGLRPGVTDIEGVSLMRTKTASFAIRPYGDKGRAWRRCKVAVDGKTSLLLRDEKDGSGNSCWLYLDAYGDSGKSVFSNFGWGNTTCEDLGAMTVAEFELREKDSVTLPSYDKKRDFKLIPGHMYRFKNDWHWHMELAIAFESYEEAPQEDARPRRRRRRGLEIASPATHVAEANGYHWFYRLEDGRAVLCRRDLPGGRRPCVERTPEGRVVVPDALDGHRVVAIDDCAFYNCDKIVEIVLPEGLEEIREWQSFGRCTSLKEVVFPKSLKRCGTLTFYGCTNLKSVNLVNCTRADSGFGCLFDNCHSLGQVLCSRQNPVVTSVDGVLYSKDKQTLLVYPKTRRELTLLPATCNIANTALVSLPYRHVKIPDGIEYVGSHNFEFDERGAIETVEFPRSLKKLGGSQFKATTSAKRVVFNGDAPEVEWSPFHESKSDVIVEVRRGSKGWNGPGTTDLPERWPVGAGEDSRPIRYIDGDAKSDGAKGKAAKAVQYVSKNKLHAAYRSKDRKRVFVEVCHQHTHDSFRTPPYTLDRVKEVINDKADILYLTLTRSKDGVLFSAERENIENISTGTGSFGDYTAAQLKRMNVKHRGQLTTEGFAKLEDMIRVGKGKILFKICGFREYAKELDELLERLDAWESVIVESWEVPADRRVCSPRMWSNILSGKLQITALGASFADWRELATECTAYGGTDDLQARGMLGVPQRVFASFTYDPGTGGRTDDEAGWEKALKDGITIFRTNRPKKLIKFLKKHNRRK